MDAKQFFNTQFGITEQDLAHFLGVALARGGDYADLYFEYRTTSSVHLEESIVKTATRGISVGVGVRVVSGEKTGYAYSDDLSRSKIEKAAHSAAYIATQAGKNASVGISGSVAGHNLYPVVHPTVEVDIDRKIALVREADHSARAWDSRIQHVVVAYADEQKLVLIANSRGHVASDDQPLSRLTVFCIAQENGRRADGIYGGGGRVGMEFFEQVHPPSYFAREAARQAIVQLGAIDCPAGTMEVVLAPGWPGILLHEAIGHGLEADFNRKKISAFSGRLGQRVASDICTVVDDGTIPSRRGSLNVDDEGTPTQQTILIENGILRGYMQDRLSADLMKMEPTGNGRREDYTHLPIPRMTNTFMMPGASSPDEIIRSVKHGLYAVQFGGGQVDITNGKFVFSASEAYLIENGKITAPVRGASLIGNGPDVLTKVVAVGNDLKLDEGIGICGKDGQSVPVGVGLPTIKVSEITVGGTQG
ncbi:MAG: metalloprotease TldD [Acidobacteriia bacterium]|nr:metalloprotease TldD [Terriglobia bacterium]